MTRLIGPDDRGAATVLAAVLTICIVVVLWLVVMLGAAASARHRAENAADLAALAAALRAPGGDAAACDRAQRIARGMGAVVSTCEWAGWEVRVEVTAELPDLFPGHAPVRARARAGPVGA
ncbi:Rv3654c family TadE-like protein [Saccharopolyspora rosea]|uniref:Rv3654c family TadE-like protein n=1 Tax=Saccharopolyspora rosea TaxID=524884 RepID=A0ABW3FRA9_9PSEU|nr:Rv3654c family TadE-like protein [Saccharopolyspora rosea]